MAKHVNLQDFVAYRKKLSDTSVALDAIGDDIYSCIVDLAVSGKWKEWADAQPIGLEYEFTDDMLRDTGDECIDALWDVLDALYDAVEVMAYQAGDLTE